MPLPKFSELSEQELEGSLLLVDIDGTLTYDRGKHLEPDVKRKLEVLSARAEVFLCSNGPLSRTRALSEAVGIPCIDTIHRKPSRRVLESLSSEGKKVVVIGDKALTDGLFAANIGAKYFPVRRERHADDPLKIRIIYALDDIAGIFIRGLFPALPYLILLRPLQWVKNLLVFAPVFFAGSVFMAGAVLDTLGAFVIFSAISSAMYVFNDLRDAPQDRLHPAKRLRPIASGSVSTREARLLLGGLLFFGVAGVFILPALIPVLAAYVSLNILYSSFLKHMVVLDIVSVALFYVFRVLAGGAATATYISPWIILCVFFGALFMITGKRKAELPKASRRRVLEAYAPGVLDALLFFSAAAAVGSYALYSVLGSFSPYVVFSTLFVGIAILRLMSLMKGESGDAEYPETLVFKDKIVLVATFLWVVFMFILLYVS